MATQKIQVLDFTLTISADENKVVDYTGEHSEDAFIDVADDTEDFYHLRMAQTGEARHKAATEYMRLIRVVQLDKDEIDQEYDGED